MSTEQNIRPELIFIPGLDLPEDHPFFTDRVFIDVPSNFVEDVDRRGVLSHASVAEENGFYVCLDGQRRVRATRLANNNRLLRGDAPLLVPCFVQGSVRTALRPAPETTSMNTEAATPVITATITARGEDSTVPDNEDAVDADIEVNGVDIGQVTLLPDPGNGGRLSVWGSIENWADAEVGRWVLANGDGITVRRAAAKTSEIEAAVRASAGGYLPGDRVQGGHEGTEDHDAGRVVEVTGRSVTVAWDSGVTTTQDSSTLRED